MSSLFIGSFGSLPSQSSSPSILSVGQPAIAASGMEAPLAQTEPSQISESEIPEITVGSSESSPTETSSEQETSVSEVTPTATQSVYTPEPTPPAPTPAPVPCQSTPERSSSASIPVPDPFQSSDIQGMFQGAQTLLQGMSQVAQTLLQGATDITEIKRTLLDQLREAKDEARNLSTQLQAALEEKQRLASELAVRNTQAAKLQTEVAQRATDIAALQTTKQELEAQNVGFRQELQSSTAASVPAMVVPHYPVVLRLLSPGGQAELRYQLHTLSYLGRQSEPSAIRAAEAVGALSRVLCAELASQPEHLKTLRIAIGGSLPSGLSIAEIEQGDPIEERLMTGSGLQGCRTVASVLSWVVLKEGTVLKKAEIVPAP